MEPACTPSIAGVSALHESTSTSRISYLAELQLQQLQLQLQLREHRRQSTHRSTCSSQLPPLHSSMVKSVPSTFTIEPAAEQFAVMLSSIAQGQSESAPPAGSCTVPSTTNPSVPFSPPTTLLLDDPATAFFLSAPLSASFPCQ